MSISQKFKERAGNYEGTLNAELVKEMEESGYVFLSHQQINNSGWMAQEDWETLVENLGGEESVDATFQEEDPAFTVTHIQSNLKEVGNGSSEVLARLWLNVKKQFPQLLNT
jgi:hypothetical protein